MDVEIELIPTILYPRPVEELPYAGNTMLIYGLWIFYLPVALGKCTLGLGVKSVARHALGLCVAMGQIKNLSKTTG